MDVLFDTLFIVERGCSKYLELLKQAVLIAGFVLAEQSSTDRQSSPIIAKFLEAEEMEAAVELARQFRVRSLSKICENCKIGDLARNCRDF